MARRPPSREPTSTRKFTRETQLPTDEGTETSGTTPSPRSVFSTMNHRANAITPAAIKDRITGTAELPPATTTERSAMSDLLDVVHSGDRCHPRLVTGPVPRCQGTRPSGNPEQPSGRPGGG